MEPKGHHQRGYLPHRDYDGALQALTFRLADSLPTKVLAGWKAELKDTQTHDEAQQELLHKIAHYEDAGHGSCALRDPRAAVLVQTELLSAHDDAYRLVAWCVMPNHVHVLIRQEDHQSLGEIVKCWKGRSARSINQLLNRSGQLWARDYFDRAIRDSDHFWRAIRYIHRNPVKAGLVEEPKDWKFSSAGYGWPLPQGSSEYGPGASARIAEDAS